MFGLVCPQKQDDNQRCLCSVAIWDMSIWRLVVLLTSRTSPKPSRNWRQKDMSRWVRHSAAALLSLQIVCEYSKSYCISKRKHRKADLQPGSSSGHCGWHVPPKWLPARTVLMIDARRIESRRKTCRYGFKRSHIRTTAEAAVDARCLFLLSIDWVLKTWEANQNVHQQMTYK